MNWFKRPSIVGSDGYERKAVQGYVHTGKVARMIQDGWEIESSSPVILGGVTMNQRHFMLRKRVHDAVA